MTTTVTLDGDTRIVITRRFAAPPALVFRAHTEPALIRHWMVGPDGWTMPLCQSDSRPGGSFRFEWSDGKDVSFFATGEYLEVTPERIVHIERMFLPGPTPDNHVETRRSTRRHPRLRHDRGAGRQLCPPGTSLRGR
jgi:uncharacterized protein YndB with AHSA1/START domain